MLKTSVSDGLRGLPRRDFGGERCCVGSRGGGGDKNPLERRNVMDD